jgi:pimeloyl-ACP methyl ester carboxylesterase
LRAGARGVAGLGAAAIAAAAGWLGYSALAVDHRRPLPRAIDAERRAFDSPAAGRLSYYADSTAAGRPLVLVHSINAAASAYEMRPLFERYRDRRPVYALDLPGFGFSARADRVYSPALYAAAIGDFLATQVVEAAEGGADVVALSLGAEFAARAALDRPALARSLALIAPSGFAATGRENRAQRAARERTGDRTHRLLAAPLWSQAFYDLLTTPPSIRFFLRPLFAGPVDPGLADYGYATSHQPGARHAPLYFVAGRLFSPDIREAVYERLTMPALVLHNDRDGFVRYDTLPAVVERRPNWQEVRIPGSRGLPQFERLDETARALDRFWQGRDC